MPNAPGTSLAAALILAGCLSLSSFASPATPMDARAGRSDRSAAEDWAAYGGLAGGHFSPLRQITPANVSHLQTAWRFDAGPDGGIQTNPLVVGRTLYGYTSTSQVFALDAATGRPLWKFDAGIVGRQPSRGLTWWSDGRQSRLFAYILNFLYALNPATGQPDTSFGDAGRIDLRKDLDSVYTQNSVVLTTPGSLYKDLLILGFRAPESKPAPHGDIRAYNVRTGKIVWSFHTIPHPGEEGYASWPEGAWKEAGAANNWAGMVVDQQRGIVYAPTGSAVSDFYGADRAGDDLFANTLLALDARTGKRLWHFQAVHHDIWDRDFPSAPVLVTLNRDGKKVDAVAQTTKHGFVFVFDRVTGKPLFPIEERPFPASDVPGEKASPTQPIPTAPAPFARQRLTADMLTTRTPEAHAWAQQQFKEFRSNGQFLPLSADRQTVVFPGFDGGAEWGGPALDPRSGVLYVNANDLPWTGGLAEIQAGSAGSVTYATQCAVCHGANRQGSPPAFPSLVGIRSRLPEPQILEVIRNGKGRMPSFPALEGTRLRELLDLLSHEDSIAPPASGSSGATPSRTDAVEDPTEAKLYVKNCALCHGEDRLGAPSNYPALLGVRARLGDREILDTIHNGKGRMPGFPRLGAEETAAILRFLGPSIESIPATVASTAQSAMHSDKQELAGGTPAASARYNFTGYRKFLDPDGYPAVVPPWGTLNAVDLNTGRYLWKVPLGEYPELVAHGMGNTGSENYGGPIITASGVLFIGATIYDRKLRAFDSNTGKLLWQGGLPFSGTATPCTYMVDGKQYVVIATSGARDPKSPQGAAYVAFALP